MNYLDWYNNKKIKVKGAIANKASGTVRLNSSNRKDFFSLVAVESFSLGLL